MNGQKMIPWDVVIEILNKYQAHNPGYGSERANKYVNDEIYGWYYGQDVSEEELKARFQTNQSRQIFEELLLTRWHYHNDPHFEINETTGEYEDELVQMAWVGYYLAWNEWSK